MSKLQQKDNLFTGIESAIAADHGCIAWLRSRSTWQRKLGAIVLCSALLLFVALTRLRADWNLLSSTRFAVEFALLGITGWGAIALSLRPLHRPDLPAGLTGTCVLATGVIAIVVSAFPVGTHFHPSSLAGIDSDIFGPAGRCFIVGCILSTPIILGLWVLMRGPGNSLLLGPAGGLIAMMALSLHCPIPTTKHLLYGHSTVVWFWLLGGAIVYRWILRSQIFSSYSNAP